MLLSVVLTNFNEQETIHEFLKRALESLDLVKKEFGFEGELIFVDDHSKDKSPAVIEDMAKKDSRVRLLQLTRQMGRDICFFAGLRQAQGDAIIIMDSDLQDPPELFVELMRVWKKDQVDVVSTKMIERHGETLYKRIMLKLSYRVLAKSYPFSYSIDCGNYKLLSRRAVDEILKSDEVDPYFRAYTDWISLPQSYLPFERQPRYAGDTKFSLGGVRSYLEFFRAWTHFSYFPLHLPFFFGILFLMLFMGSGLYSFFGGGFESLVVCLISFGFGSVLLVAWLFGFYLRQIHTATRRRPHYIVNKKENL